MKRVFAIILAACIFASISVCASAADANIADVGKTVLQLDDWMYEKINNDTQWELDEYIGEGGEVYVPRIFGDLLIVRLGDHCFSNNANVTSVITSSPLWTVGEYCFVNCTTIESFECNYALNTIESGAFSGTSSLKSINLQDSIVTEIMPYTFLNSGIEEITLPETCTKLGIYSFAQCIMLKKIVIPDSVTEIADTAFSGCDNLVIYGTKNSYAIEYAVANGIDYVITDAEPEPLTVTFILGDADGDGVVSIIDATKIQRVLADLDPDDDGMIALRSISDGLDVLNIMHATKIQRFLAGFIMQEPIGTEVTCTIPADTGNQ